MTSDWNTKDPMKILRWLGLHCILLGMLACSTSNNTVGLQKKSKDTSKPVARTYVGLKTPPLPQGHETEVGYLLGTEDQGGRHAIEVVSFGSEKIVWMERLLYHDEQGRAHWEIIATLPAQQLPAGYQFSGGNCLNESKPQPEIVAIFKMEKKKALTHVFKAWKADPQKGTFERLSNEGIQCSNERMSHQHH